MRSNAGISSRGTRAFEILSGIAPLPSHMIIGAACCKGHSINGQSVRYKKSRECIVCRRMRDNERVWGKQGKRDLTALHVYEDRQEADDHDPLFDGE